MTFFKICLQILGLWLLNWVGIWIQSLLHLPLPGSIIGLLILFLLLVLGILPESFIGDGAHFLLKVLPFLFLPSVLGIMGEGHFFKTQGLLFIGIIVVSTFLTMGFAALATETVQRLRSKELERRTPHD